METLIKILIKNKNSIKHWLNDLSTKSQAETILKFIVLNSPEAPLLQSLTNFTDTFNVEQVCGTGAPDYGSQMPLLGGRKALCMLWMKFKAPQKSNLNTDISQDYFIIKISGQPWSQASSPFSMRKCENPTLSSSFALDWKLGTSRQDSDKIAHVGFEPFFSHFLGSTTSITCSSFPPPPDSNQQLENEFQTQPASCFKNPTHSPCMCVCTRAQFNLLWLQNCFCTTTSNFFIF